MPQCTAIDDLATDVYATTGMLVIDEHGQMHPDEYGSGYVLCWATVGRLPGPAPYTVECLRGHTLAEMREGAERAGRPNAGALA